MGKKEEVKPLPVTTAETAEKRLEELVSNKSITEYIALFENRSECCLYPYDGEARLYPDGFEAVTFNVDYQEGRLHVERRRIFIRYDLEKDYAKQSIKSMDEK